MEKSNKILVAEAHFDWNDLGSWDALEEVCQRDGENIKVKADEIYSDGARGNIVFAPDDLVALIGVEDLVIVRKDDTLLVMKKDQSQKVKQLVDFVANHPKFKGRV